MYLFLASSVGSGNTVSDQIYFPTALIWVPITLIMSRRKVPAEGLGFFVCWFLLFLFLFFLCHVFYLLSRYKHHLSNSHRLELHTNKCLWIKHSVWLFYLEWSSVSLTGMWHFGLPWVLCLKLGKDLFASQASSAGAWAHVINAQGPQKREKDTLEL